MKETYSDNTARCVGIRCALASAVGAIGLGPLGLVIGPAIYVPCLIAAKENTRRERERIEQSPFPAAVINYDRRAGKKHIKVEESFKLDDGTYALPWLRTTIRRTTKYDLD